MQRFSTTPLAMAQSFGVNFELIRSMVMREVLGRYQGSVLGLGWSFFNPLLMLLIYTFVFAGIFKARWGVMPNETKVDFAIILFVGLIVHGLFAECVNRAPGLILQNPNYVKKVVFPLEILPVVALGAALFHALVSVFVLLLVQFMINHHLPWTLVFFPIILLPLLLITLGVSWFLAALGVYLRDVVQVTGMMTTVLLFLSPVFYPASKLGHYRVLMDMNPLAYIIEECRAVLIFGKKPDFFLWLAMMGVGFLVAWLGYAWMQKTRKGFADVI